MSFRHTVILALATMGCVAASKAPRAARIGAPNVLQTPVVGRWERAIEPLNWDGRDIKTRFGAAVAYDGEGLFVGADSEHFSFGSGLYVFAAVRGEPREESAPLDSLAWVGRFSTFPPMTLGDSVAACGGGRFFAMTSTDTTLIFTKARGGWSVDRIVPPPAGARFRRRWAGCSLSDIAAAGEDGSVFVYSLERGKWSTFRTEKAVDRLTVSARRLFFAVGPSLRILDLEKVSLLGTLPLPSRVEAMAAHRDWLFVKLVEDSVVGASNILVFRFLNEKWAAYGELGATVGVVSIVAEDGIVAAGMPYANDAGHSAGAVQLFRLKEGRWIPDAKVLARIAIPAQHFGAFLALKNGELVVSAPGDPWVPGCAYVVDLVGDRARPEKAGESPIILAGRRISFFAFEPPSHFPN